MGFFSRGKNDEQKDSGSGRGKEASYTVNWADDKGRRFSTTVTGSLSDLDRHIQTYKSEGYTHLSTAS